VADLATELQRIYNSEINIRIGWFWDGGIDVRLGSSPRQKSQDSGTTGETFCPTELHQQFASVVEQAFSLSGLLPRTARLADDRNGYLAEETVSSVMDIIRWLQETIAHFYPESDYAASLRPEVHERVRVRLFRPPGIGAQVRCAHCGATHAAPEMDELIAFICPHCGNSVELEKPAVQ